MKLQLHLLKPKDSRTTLSSTRLRAANLWRGSSIEREIQRGENKKNKNLKTQGRAQPSCCLSLVGIFHRDLLHLYTRDVPSPYFRHHRAAALPLIAHKTNRVATVAQSKWRDIVWDQPSGGKHPWTCRETCFLLGLEN